MRYPLPIASLILVLASTASGQITKADLLPKERAFQKAAELTGRTDRKFSVHNGNRILTRFYNFGGIGDWTIAGRYDSGIYPTGSGRSYIAEFTPVIAASVVGANGSRLHIVSDGMVSNNGKDLSPSGVQWGFEPLGGYADPNQPNIAMSDDPGSWPETWPNRASDWDGLWNGKYGKFSRADQESYFVMDDSYNDEFAFYPDPADSSRRGLGVEVEVRGYQWAHVAAEDIIIWTYWITNKGASALDSVVFGMYGDADVGDDGDQRDDDSFFDRENAIVYQWDHDGHSNAKGGFKPAYFGWKFLESPGNPTDGIDNDFDGMVDESQFNGIDDDGDWDPDVDDLGTDGIGPEHEDYLAPDADGSEGNGQPDAGEPNFEFTDNDESDQIGLTSFFAATWPSITASNDEVLWNQLTPGFFSVPEQTVDITFLYGSGYFRLEAGERKKFAVAMLFGEDQADILRNAITMQAIYDADYSFALPPRAPKLTAVPGDRQVALYWDRKAEKSRDPIYGFDFEGYRIYRATDPAFIEPWIVTDAYGNRTFSKPIAIFDLADGLAGPHPIAHAGIQFDMGEDSGLRHFWVDTTVQNGQRYYYAVASYDKGYDDDFFSRDLTAKDGLLPVAPTESIYVVDLDASGEVLALGPNVASVVPNSPAAGYVPANTPTDGFELVRHDSGAATGRVLINVVDPGEIRDGWSYQVNFARDNSGTSYSVENLQVQSDTIAFSQGIAQLTLGDVVPGSMMLTSLDGGDSFQESVDFLVDEAAGRLTALTGALVNGKDYLASYRTFPIASSSYVDGEPLNPIFDGLQLLVYDESLALLTESSGWIAGDCGYTPNISFDRAPYAGDFEIRWEGGIGDSIAQDDFFGVAVPFTIWNLTEDRPSRFVIIEGNRDGQWDPADNLFILPEETGIISSFKVSFSLDSLLITPRQVGDSTIYDTIKVSIEPVEAGDILGIYTSKPFASNDRYRFTSRASRIDSDLASSQLDQIAVVPNPYVVTASWEPQHLFVSGRGTRKIDFINLPMACTIKIFTLSGHLADTIEHTSLAESGSASWNMLSRHGLEIAYGVYLYHVAAPGIGEIIGKFALIK